MLITEDAEGIWHCCVDGRKECQNSTRSNTEWIGIGWWGCTFHRSFTPQRQTYGINHKLDKGFKKILKGHVYLASAPKLNVITIISKCQVLFSENSCRRVGALRVLSLGRKLKRTGWHNNSLWNCRSKSRRILLVKENEKRKSHLSDTRNIPDRIKWINLNTRPTTSILLRSLGISQTGRQEKETT